jgi:hypothetical protein
MHQTTGHRARSPHLHRSAAGESDRHHAPPLLPRIPELTDRSRPDRPQTTPISTFTLSDGKRMPWLAWGNGTGDAKKTVPKTLPIVLDAFGQGAHIDTAQVRSPPPCVLRLQGG